MRSGGLFAGYGGLDMAVAEVFGAELAWFSEIDDAPSKILAHHWPDVPNHGDITQIDWGQVEPVDVLSGGFPCQDVSAAGKRAGLHPDNRSGLWNHMAYAISKLRPRYVVAENVRGLLSAEAHSDVEPCPWCLGDGPGEPALRALGAVLGDLADLGYDAQWCGLRAADVGAPHGRYRIFVLATDAAHDYGGWGADAGAPGWRPGRATRHAEGEQRQWSISSRGRGRGSEASAGDTDRALAYSDGPTGREWRITAPGQTESRRPRPDTGRRSGVPAADANGDAIREQSSAWGDYGHAIHRWERVLGCTAPAPTEPNSKGAQRLSPRFVEWMMGLPAGHVTGVPGLDRNGQLKALGNGVVPQQAIAALRHMYAAERREVA